MDKELIKSTSQSVSTLCLKQAKKGKREGLAVRENYQSRDLWNAVEVADYIGVSRHTVYQWISDLKFPVAYVKLPRCVRFPSKDVKKWVDSLKVKPIDAH